MTLGSCQGEVRGTPTRAKQHMSDPAQLYETDFFRWTQEQAALLRQVPGERINLPIDWRNAADEIEDMGRRDLHSIHSRIRLILEHLLKLEHSPVLDPRAGWIHTIDRYRDEIEDLLADSPSLRGRLADGWGRDYARARRTAVKGLSRDGVPAEEVALEPAYTIDQALDPDWWPVSRHGHTT